MYSELDDSMPVLEVLYVDVGVIVLVLFRDAFVILDFTNLFITSFLSQVPPLVLPLVPQLQLSSVVRY